MLLINRKLCSGNIPQVSYLVETKCAFSWKLRSSEETASEFPMNHIAYSLLEQSVHPVVVRDSDFESDIQRLEYKLNLVIQMLGQVIQPQQSRPDVMQLRLGTDSIAWNHPGAKIGEQYSVSLFLNPSIAVPIEAIVRVTDVTDGWCTASFVNRSTDEQSAWERWVFRLHRRDIAHSREPVD
jgi:hypothetical protein